MINLKAWQVQKTPAASCKYLGDIPECQAVECVPRQHTECTNDIPVSFNETEVFVDPISLVIKIATSSVIRNDIDPPR